MSREYFTGSLNYTLANEDTSLELAVLPERAEHVFSVAGSGGRVLPLLARNPRRVTCVDLSKEQLHLTELRIEATRALTHGEFLAFWGYPPRTASCDERRELFDKIRLTSEAREFLRQLFEARDWQSVLYLGKWERTFITLSQINRRFTGLPGRGLFECLSLEEQLAYLELGFPKKAWSAVLFLFGNATIFNALLYKGHFPKKNIPESYFGFYARVFDHLFRQAPARQSFFLQLLFFGKVIFGEGCPIECDPEVYRAAKASLSETEVRYESGDILKLASSIDMPIDFFSFSDVPSYFTGEIERNYLQTIAPKLNPGALVVIRNYLRLPEALNLKGFESVTEEHRASIDAEKVGVYLVDVQRRS